MTDMSTYVTREEFETRLRVLVGEVEGEKAVTRHILEQTHRSSDDLGTIKSRLDHLAGNVAIIKADFGRHGRMLDVLVQDMRIIRAAVEGRDAPGARRPDDDRH